MASRKFFHAKPNYIYPEFPQGSEITSDTCKNHFEFDEADLWNSSPNIEAVVDTKKPIPSSRSSKKLFSRKNNNSIDQDHHQHQRVASSSLPVNIPDWSKILKEDNRRDHSDEDFDDGNNDFDGGHYRSSWVPPHEFLARRRGASFSVHEGIGRTLKGSDLRRVRNAIWKKVGFED